MNTSSLATFYLALFAIAMAFAGVAIAAVIAVAQILQGILSFRTSRKIFASGSFRAFATTMLLAVAVAGVPSFLLSFEHHDFVPSIELHTTSILSNPLYAVATIVCLLASLVSFFLLVYEETRYLVPGHALAFFRKSLEGTASREYLKSRYAAPPMYLPPLAVSQTAEAKDAATAAEASGPAGSTPTGKAEWAQRQAKYDSDMERYETDRRRWERLDNPFAPIEYYIVQAVHKGDLPVLLTALKTFEGLIADSAGDDEYQARLVMYYSEILRHSTDIGVQNSLSSPLRYLIDSSRNVHEFLIEAKRPSIAEPVQAYLKDTADRCMGVIPSVFTQIMAAYRDIGTELLRADELEWEDAQAELDNIFRHLGWLGERLLAAAAPEVRPVMHDDEYETEFDSLMNALLGIGSGYDTRRADKYPLIYFDALYVVARSLTPYYKPDEEADGSAGIGDTLFSLMYQKKSFAERAMRARNADGTALAVLKLTEHARLAQEAGHGKQLGHVMDALLDLGVLAASIGDELPKSLLNTGNLAEAIKNSIAKYADPTDLVKEAREVLIKLNPDVKHEVARIYVKDVGLALGVDWDGHALYESWRP